MHRHATVIRRRLVVFIAAVLAVSACSREKIARSDASAVIQSSASFKQGRVFYVPRVVSIPAEEIGGSVSAREGEALTITEIASVDPIVALLRARGQVSIEDFVSPVASSIVHPPNPDSVRADSIKKDSTAKADSAKSADSVKKLNPDSAKGNVGEPLQPPPAKPPLDRPQTSPPPQPPLAKRWVHTIRVTPNQRPEMGDLSVDDGSDFEDSPRPDYSGRAIGRIPGWTLAVAGREFIRVLEVTDRNPPKDGPPGEIVVDFLWRWRPTRAGALFDVDGAEFQSLPAEVQQAVQGGSLTLDASTPLWSRATLARDTHGWRVTFIDWSYGLGKPHQQW